MLSTIKDIRVLMWMMKGRRWRRFLPQWRRMDLQAGGTLPNTPKLHLPPPHSRTIVKCFSKFAAHQAIVLTATQSRRFSSGNLKCKHLVEGSKEAPSEFGPDDLLWPGLEGECRKKEGAWYLKLSQKSVKTEGQHSHGYIPDTVTEM